MFSSSSCVCAVNYQARCIREQRASTERHRFIVGTCSTRDKNELNVLEYDEDGNTLDVSSIYNHPNEVWALETSPDDPSLVITSGNGIYNNERQSIKSSVNLFRMPNQTEHSIRDGGEEQREAAYAGEKLELECLASLDCASRSIVNSIKWNKMNQVVTSDSQFVSLYSVADEVVKSLGNVNIYPGSSALSGSCREVEFYDCSNVAAGGCGLSWDPHSTGVCAVAARGDLKVVSTAALQVTLTVQNAHHGCIRDVDYNPNKPNVLVTAGDDCKVKFWDLRHTKAPIKTLSGHSHWAWSAKYNPAHDQLIISGGSDHLVNLWRVSSVSSMPWENPVAETGVLAPDSKPTSLHKNSNDEDKDECDYYAGGRGDDDDDDVRDSNDAEPEPVDMKVRVVDQHEDSVYSVAWSPCEAWMFCSLSYDGRIILSHVPSTEKYKILL